eukprot:4646784-Pyramimonas_sp.AAC.1
MQHIPCSAPRAIPRWCAYSARAVFQMLMHGPLRKLSVRKRTVRPPLKERAQTGARRRDSAPKIGSPHETHVNPTESVSDLRVSE